MSDLEIINLLTRSCLLVAIKKSVCAKAIHKIDYKDIAAEVEKEYLSGDFDKYIEMTALEHKCGLLESA